MKTPIASLLSALILFSACAKEKSDMGAIAVPPDEIVEVADKTDGFNAKLAQELGADPYGMRSYVFATLLTGPNDATITDKDKRAELFKGHFSNMGRLAEDGKLVLAGPFVEAGNMRGLFILNVETIAEAEALVQTDPSIKAGIFKVEFAKYYGSAALMKVNEIHKSIQEKDI